MEENTLKAALSIIGRRGGRIGGKRCLETMTPEERKVRATLASAAARVVNQRKAEERRKARLESQEHPL